MIETRAGLILQAIRDDQNRARYLGFDVPLYQTFFFAVSAGIAGLAGMFYVVVSEFASPTFMDLTSRSRWWSGPRSAGASSILGACIGAIVINMISATVSETEGFAEAWKVDHRPDLRPGRAVSAARFRRAAHDLVDRLLSRRKRCAPQRPRPVRCLATGGVDTMAETRLTIDGLGVDFGGFKAVNVSR